MPLVEAQKILTKYFSDFDPWNLWRFLTNKDIFLQSRPLTDIVNSIFRPPYAVSALNSKFSSASIVVEQISMLYLFSTTPTAKEFWKLASNISSGSTSGGSQIPRKPSESLLHTWLFWLLLK